jgi:hypothetical protein
MQLNELLQHFLGRAARDGATPLRRRSFRLTVESLEDRTTPANFTAGNVPDLIAAINAANLTAESDTITLVAGKTFTLNAINNTTNGANGLPVVVTGEDLTIIGNGDMIERSTAKGTAEFRLFDVAAGASLTLRDTTLQGGLASGSWQTARGGAIYNQGALTLEGVTVQNNTARACDDAYGGGQQASGGGIFSNGAQTSLTVVGCTIKNNQAVGGRGSDGYIVSGPFGTTKVPGGKGGAAFGGGILVGGGCVVSINDTTITGNTALGGRGGDGANYKGIHVGSYGGGDARGGGLFVYSDTASVTVRTTRVTSNTAQGGSGPYGINGEGIGGGIYIHFSPPVAIDAFTLANLAGNKATTSHNDIYGTYSVIP